MDIYLVRHAQTEWDEDRRIQGWRDSALTLRGREDAKYLAHELRNVEFSQIYSSPLGRALETAKYLKMGRNMEIAEVPAFKEMHLGAWEGLIDREVKEKYPEDYFNFMNRPNIFKAQGGEDFVELRDRVKKGLKELIRTATGERIIVVTHPFVIRTMLSIVQDYPVDDFWNQPFLKSTSLSVLRVGEEGKIEVIVENDISHLD
jgi:probable phosphoglycerate mutase